MWFPLSEVSISDQQEYCSFSMSDVVLYHYFYPESLRSWMALEMGIIHQSVNYDGLAIGSPPPPANASERGVGGDHD